MPLMQGAAFTRPRHNALCTSYVLPSHLMHLNLPLGAHTLCGTFGRTFPPPCNAEMTRSRSHFAAPAMIYSTRSHTITLCDLVMLRDAATSLAETRRGTHVQHHNNIVTLGATAKKTVHTQTGARVDAQCRRKNAVPLRRNRSPIRDIRICMHSHTRGHGHATCENILAGPGNTATYAMQLRANICI